MSCFPNDHQFCLSSLNLTPRASDSDTPIPHLSKWVSSSGKSRPIIMDQLPPLHAWCHLGRLQQLQQLLPMHPITSPLEHRRTLLTTLPPHPCPHSPHGSLGRWAQLWIHAIKIVHDVSKGAPAESTLQRAASLQSMVLCQHTLCFSKQPLRMLRLAPD